MKLKRFVSIVFVAGAVWVVADWPGYAQKTEKASKLFAGIAGDDWLRFRGPNGSGVAEGAALPADFGPTKNHKPI